ncbi:MAG: hypothetical protein GY749_33160 [Desulfobacteraceae bacterium]|nr:hypothetical protein [Desulfobacteraceae bacterium]
MEHDNLINTQDEFLDETKYVMIIDDNPAITSLYNRLARTGYKTDVYDDPLKIREAELRKYPVFIIDYNMINMCGDELIPVIQEKNGFAYLIVYTGFPSIDKYETLKKLNLLGVDFWAEKGDKKMVDEMFVRLDYAFRRLENIFSPLHLNK